MIAAEILSPEGPRLRLTTQPDHAVLAAEILGLWRTAAFPQHPRRAEILFAVREHDNGWREVDAAPRVDRGTGAALTFETIPAELRFEIWLRGVARFAEERPYAALLIAEHAAHLHRRHRDSPAWAEFFAALDEDRMRLREDAAEAGFEVSDEELAADYSWLEVTDLLSLAAASVWLEPFELEPAAAGGCALCRFRLQDVGTLELDPFPLAGATTFPMRYREVPARRFTSDSDAAVELASARWQTLSLRLQAA